VGPAQIGAKPPKWGQFKSAFLCQTPNMKLPTTITTLITAPLAVLLAVPLALTGPPPATAPSAVALSEIPETMLRHYITAVGTCDGLDWTVLAGIGAIETGHTTGRTDPATGQLTGPKLRGYAPVGRDTDQGALDSDPTQDWAVGAMQFTPATWTAYQTLGTDRTAGAMADIDNTWDSIATAARYVCELIGLFPGDLPRAVGAYNCGPNATPSCGTGYAADVMAKADLYRKAVGGVPGQTYTGDIAIVIATALAQLGKPYVFGTQGPDTFDCSGLVTYAYRAIGIELPAYTFTLINYGTAIAPDDIQPGDLIFTRGGTPPENYGHVAIAISPTKEIQAPRTGDTVEITSVPTAPQAVRRLLTPLFKAGLAGS
jgi:cell wall-associated NlpC family hydrolase